MKNSNDKKLKKSEKEFQLLAESLPQIVWVTDAEGKNIFFNHQWTEYTGLTIEESMGHGWNKPFHPDDQLSAWNKWQNAVKKNDSYSLECRIKKYDGTYGWWLVRGVPIQDSNGQIIKWFGTCTDINEIKKNEESLRISQENFRLLVESAIDYAIFKISPDGTIQTWNLGGERITGYKQKEVIGKNFELFYPIKDKLKKIPTHDLRNAINIKRNEFEGLRERKDGSMFWANEVIIPLYNNEKELTGFSIVTRDITERKKIEEERKTREQYLLTIIHDLRTPLTIVKLNTQLIQKSAMGLNKIITSIDRADQMITDLLDVNIIKSGEKFPLTFEKFEIHELIKSTINDLTAIYGDRFVLIFNEPVEGYWSKNNIRRVIENLLTNAIKYGSKDTKISVKIEKSKQIVKILVHNLGNPIEEESLKDIFLPRHRILNKNTSDIKGWGIGLTLVKGITEAHGGNIQVKSSIDEGTTFIVTLPIDSSVREEDRVNRLALSNIQ